MIVVIADDLSGAAELAGIGLQFGMRVELHIGLNQPVDTDLLVIATDTRSMNEQKAVDEIETVATKVYELHPLMVYKKVDSVLRGHVLAELKAQLKISTLQKILLVPANPQLGRTLVNGAYFFNDHPIHLSSFSTDPEFPIKTSDVAGMLKAKTGEISINKFSDHIDADIIVGEAENAEDLREWAMKNTNDVLLAGASGFFKALLSNVFKGGQTITIKAGKQGKISLFVCGTTFSKSRAAIKQLHKNGSPVNYIPPDLLNGLAFDEEECQDWVDETITLIKANCTAIIAIDEEPTKTLNVSASQLRERMAFLVSEILKKIKIHELMIEGGSTAAAIIRKLNYAVLVPLEELAPGVIRMNVKENPKLCITIKPGSYNWPESIWNF